MNNNNLWGNGPLNINIIRLIPLLLFLFCIYLAFNILSSNSSESFIAGHLLIFLGMVCLNIFFLASLICKQLLGESGSYLYPLLGYLVALFSIFYGLFLVSNSLDFYKVTGHNVSGLGLICLCIATETLVCTRFREVEKNSRKEWDSPPVYNFSKNITTISTILPIAAVFTGWSWALYLIFYGNYHDNFIPGHVLAGMSMVCTCILAAIVTTFRQINNSYQKKDQVTWPILTFVMGIIAFIWGLLLLFLNFNSSSYIPTGFLLIGISFVCWSISTKLFMASRTWRKDFKHIMQVPLIPFFLFIISLVLAVSLYFLSSSDINLYIPARVIMGMGSVCLSLCSVITMIALAKKK